MKNLLITATIVGIATAALIIYLTDDASILRARSRDAKDAGDAAEDAYKTMNKHIGNVERKAGKVFDDLS